MHDKVIDLVDAATRLPSGCVPALSADCKRHIDRRRNVTPSTPGRAKAARQQFEPVAAIASPERSFDVVELDARSATSSSAIPTATTSPPWNARNPRGTSFLAAMRCRRRGYVPASRWFLESPNGRAVNFIIIQAFSSNAIFCASAVRATALPPAGIGAVVLDNGSENTVAVEILPICGADYLAPPAAEAWHRGGCEGLFRIVHAFYAWLPGQTKRDIYVRKGKPPDLTNLLTLEELNKLWFRWLHDVYHAKARKDVDGRCPRKIVEADRALRRPLPVPSEKSLAGAAAIRASAKLVRSGLRYQNITYFSLATKNAHHQRRRDVPILVDPRRLDKIEADLGDGYVEVPIKLPRRSRTASTRSVWITGSPAAF